MKLRNCGLLVLSALVLPLLASNAFAGVLGPDLSTMALFGGAGVAINGTGSVIVGSIGTFPSLAITGVVPTNYTQSGGTSQAGTGVASNAAAQLGTAINALNNTLPQIAEPASLGTLTLNPGVYSFSADLLLTGALTLNGLGDANAFWIFNITGSLTAQTGSSVHVINAGPGAGLYWNEGGSATINSLGGFEGNVLAHTAITVGTNVTDLCGRMLALTASVTLAGNDNIGVGCAGLTASEGGGSNAFNGGQIVTLGGVPSVIPTTPTPEPQSVAFLLLGFCGIGGVAIRRVRARSTEA